MTAPKGTYSYAEQLKIKTAGLEQGAAVWLNKVDSGGFKVVPMVTQFHGDKGTKTSIESFQITPAALSFFPSSLCSGMFQTITP